jgi:nitric oxide reductase NorE protein
VPGEVGIWVFILGDMLAFALFFGVFVYERANAPALFDSSRHELTVGFAVANTLLLLTSSLFVAGAVRMVREGAQRLAPRLFGLAFLCGLGFVANKAFEYGEQLHHGVTPATNHFYMYFYMLTGIHLLHVVIGLGVLGFLWHVSRRGAQRPNDVMAIETGASYWHMVDLLWIVLFPLLYLMSS